MTGPIEIFDIVDEHDRVIGQAPRAEVHRHRLRHRAVHILVFNEDGDLFIQKRAASKDEFPNCYDSSAAGHLDQGEDYDTCARRELREELDLVIPADRWEKLFQIAACPETGCEFVWVYRVTTSESPRINRQEIESGEFWPLPRVLQAVAAHPEQFATGFVRILHEWRKRTG